MQFEFHFFEKTASSQKIKNDLVKFKRTLNQSKKSKIYHKFF